MGAIFKPLWPRITLPQFSSFPSPILVSARDGTRPRNCRLAPVSRHSHFRSRRTMAQLFSRTVAIGLAGVLTGSISQTLTGIDKTSSIVLKRSLIWSDIPVHPRLKTPFLESYDRMSGHGNYGDMLPAHVFPFADGCRRFQAIHLWHFDIHQYQVEGLFLQGFQGRQARVRDNDRVPPFSKMRTAKIWFTVLSSAKRIFKRPRFSRRV
jgi:hypothetical protein